jgi:hypothetical protein
MLVAGPRDEDNSTSFMLDAAIPQIEADINIKIMTKEYLTGFKLSPLYH